MEIYAATLQNNNVVSMPADMAAETALDDWPQASLADIRIAPKAIPNPDSDKRFNRAFILIPPKTEESHQRERATLVWREYISVPERTMSILISSKRDGISEV